MTRRPFPRQPRWARKVHKNESRRTFRRSLDVVLPLPETGDRVADPYAAHQFRLQKVAFVEDYNRSSATEGEGKISDTNSQRQGQRVQFEAGSTQRAPRHPQGMPLGLMHRISVPEACRCRLDLVDTMPSALQCLCISFVRYVHANACCVAACVIWINYSRCMP